MLSRLEIWRRKLHMTPLGTILSVIDTGRGREPISRIRRLWWLVAIAAVLFCLWRYAA